MGIVDRKFGRRRAIVAAAHFMSALLLVLMAADSAPHFPVSDLFGVTVMSSRATISRCWS